MKRYTYAIFSSMLIFGLATGLPELAVAKKSKEEKAAAKIEKQNKKRKKNKKTKHASDIKEDEDIGNLRISGIDVVQNRVFAKTGRHEFAFGAGAILDNPFLRYQLAQFRYNYHFRETFSVELSYQYAFNQRKALVRQLENIECAPGEFFDEDGIDLSSVPGACGVIFSSPPDPYQHIYLANFVWSPIYGKFSIFSRKIYHFDFFLTAGLGWYDTERSGYLGFNAGVGAKVFLSQWLAFRADIRNVTVKEGAPFNNVVNNRILSLGLSLFTPSKNKREK